MAKDPNRKSIGEMTGEEILDVLELSIDEATRWPRLEDALALDPGAGPLGSVVLNNAFEERGLGRPLPERIRDWPTSGEPFSDQWWRTIAETVTGNPDTATSPVIDALREMPVLPRKRAAVG